MTGEQYKHIDHNNGVIHSEEIWDFNCIVKKKIFLVIWSKHLNLLFFWKVKSWMSHLQGHLWPLLAYKVLKDGSRKSEECFLEYPKWITTNLSQQLSSLRHQCQVHIYIDGLAFKNIRKHFQSVPNDSYGFFPLLLVCWIIQFGVGWCWWQCFHLIINI